MTKDYIGKVTEGYSLEVLKDFEDNSIDAIVTDPPYEIAFMGAKWDNTGIAYSVELWKECLRVLKPGGHILSFGATKTYHRMACAIEDAGFETRNCINWIYMQGFSKGLNVSKAFDKKAGAEREVIGKGASQPARSGHFGGLTADSINYEENKERYQPDITAPATDKAKEWDGWHTDLKPSHELIYMGRKPLSEGTIVDNIEKWDTGALNIDESRIEANPDLDDMHRTVNRGERVTGGWKDGSGMKNEKNLLTGIPAEGRFPTNTIIDGSPEVLAELRKSGVRTSGSMKPHHQVGAKTGDGYLSNKVLGQYSARPFVKDVDKNSGTIDRFFKKCEFTEKDIPAFLYVPKPSQAEKNLGCEHLRKEINGRIVEGNFHTTVKPVKLMGYLIQLITPKNGIVLDLFCGSGTTLVAAEELSFYWIGIDDNPDAVKISNARLKPFTNLNSIFDER